MNNINNFPNTQNNPDAQPDSAQSLASMPSFNEYKKFIQEETIKSPEITFDDYIKQSAITLSDAGYNGSYYEPEDGETPADGYESGIEDLQDRLKLVKGIENLYQNNVGIRKCLDSGLLHDVNSEYDSSEMEIFETLPILAQNYFSESTPQQEKELMKSIITMEPTDDGTLANHYDLTDEQKSFLESKDDIISHRLLEDREGLTDGWKNEISNVKNDAFKFIDEKRRESRTYIIARLKAVKKLLQKRQAAGITNEDGEMQNIDSFIDYLEHSSF